LMVFMMKNNYTRCFLVIFLVALVAFGISTFKSPKMKDTKIASSSEENEANMGNHHAEWESPGEELSQNMNQSLEGEGEEGGEASEEVDESEASETREKTSKDDTKKKKKQEPFDLEKMLAIIDQKFDSDLEKAMLKDGLKTYEENSLLPSNLTPFGNKSSDPLEKKNNETIVTSQNSVSGTNVNGNNNNHNNNDEEVDLNIYAVASKEKSAYVANEDPIELYFEAYNKDVRIPAQVKAEVFNEDKELVTTLAYREVSPLKYLTTFENPYEFSDTPEGKYFVKIQATAKTDKSVSKKINMIESFSINSKKSRFSGSVNDMLTSQGNLLVNVAYRVYVSGTYLIQASLYDNAGKMIAFYEEPMHLERASQVVIPLEFHGYFFYLRKLNGPFNLKNISLSYVNSNLTNEVGGVNTPNYVTKNYQWTEFNQSPYENTQIRDKIKSIDNYLSSILASNDN